MSSKSDCQNSLESVDFFNNLVGSEDYKSFHRKNQTSRLFLARILEIMDKRNIKQTELSKLTGIAQPTISRLFNGNRPNFSMDTFLQICDGLGVEVELKV